MKNKPKNKENNQKAERPWVRFVCHQIPERCFVIFGKRMPICSRCTGVYSGLGIGLLLPFILYGIYSINVSVLLFLLIIGLAPMALDGFTQFRGLRKSNNHLRFITGFVGGLFLGIMFNWLLVHVFILD